MLKVSKLLTSTLAFLLLASSNVAIGAETTELKVIYNAKEVEKFFNENSFSESQEKNLRKKISNNELLDCYKEENLKNIPDDFNYIDLSDMSQSKKYYFEDGSFIEISVAPNSEESKKIEITDENIKDYPMIEESLKNDNPIRTRSITNSSYGTLYVNHRVSRSVGLQTASFVANFYQSRYGNSRIYESNDGNGYNSPFGEQVSGFGINALASKEMIRAVEDRSTSQGAIFRLYWLTTGEVSAEWKGIGGSMPIGTTCNLYLALVRGQMYVAPELPF